MPKHLQKSYTQHDSCIQTWWIDILERQIFFGIPKNAYCKRLAYLKFRHMENEWKQLCLIIIITNNNNNKKTSLAPISSENPSSVAQQNQRIRHFHDHVQCKKSPTDGWRCQEAKEDRPSWKDRFSDYGEMKLYFLVIFIFKIFIFCKPVIRTPPKGDG